MNNLITAISNNGGAVIHVIDSTDIVHEMEKLHTTSATASAALGRLLTAAALIGNMQKGKDDVITIKLKGGGPIGTVTAICDSHGNVRGSCDNPLADLPLNPKNNKLDVGGLVGADGVLIVMRDSGAGEPYIGQVELVSGEVAEDITHYYATSEQVPTVCALGVLVNPDLTIKAAGGFILQLMPGASDDEITLIENNITKLNAVTTLLDAGSSPVDIANKVLSGFEPEILSTSPAQYKCNCSREKMQRIMKSLGETELQELAEEAPDTEIVCSYCDKKYLFSAEELRELSI